MKKAFAVSLILVLAGNLFAQELKFDGYVNSGLGLLLTNEEDVDPALRAFGADSEQWGYRFRLNGSVTGEEGNAGLKFRFQSQSKISAGYFSLPYAYGWIKLLNGIITLSGGLVDDGTWNSGGAVLDEDVGEGLGALAKVSPIDGLDLGAGAYILGYNSGGNNNVLLTDDFSNAALKPWEAKYTINAGYTAADLFRVTAAFRVKIDAAYDTGDSNTGRDESTKGIIGVKVLAVRNLTAIVEGEIDKLNDFSDTGIINFYETLGYKLGDLGMGLNAVQYISRKDEADIGLRFNPWVSYTLGSIVPRLDLVYFMAGTPDTEGKYHRKNYKPNYNADYSIFTIRPAVKFNLNPKTFVEAGDLIGFEKGPGNTFADKNSRLVNVLYVDFKWSF
ncbi:MAG: hypothetical protein LBP32_00560 [Spirochaetaceae bacterium]|jgi:hypothetical protein|nr:hypothetical protein [Spirochaetaceae bacterium]